ncbi:MAG: glycosyltransferase [Ferruginibacter sp.]
MNYIFNIVAALKTLEDSIRPRLVVFYSENAPIEYIHQLNYPEIHFQLLRDFPENWLLRKFNGLFKRISGIDPYTRLGYFAKTDCLYPYFEFLDKRFDGSKNKIHWLVDFNNRVFSDHYQDGGELMKKWQDLIVMRTGKVVLSSNALKQELYSYYPSPKCDLRILRFASTIELPPENTHAPVLKKFALADSFVLSPNQFWEHKNQLIVLEALKLIRESRPEMRFRVLFTGSMQVNRGKGAYVESLLFKVKEYGLASYVSFLGVLDRSEQLILMKHASCLLQPSLYEGWSTLVEEAKALNKFIILSDLPVHKEQINKNCYFFDRYSPTDLADSLVRFFTEKPQVVQLKYEDNIHQFAKDIMEVLN